MLFLLMMLAIICLWWLAQMKDIYQRTPNKKDFWTFYRFRYPLTIFMLVILPLIAVNKWVPDTVEVHGQEAVRFGERTDDYRIRIRGYQEMLAKDSLDLDLHFRYLEDYFSYQWGQDRPMVIIERYQKYKASDDPAVANIGYLGELLAETFSYRFEQFDQLLQALPADGTRKYMHHCTGRYLYYYHNTDSAIHHWQQEIATGGDTAHTIDFWSRVLEWEDRREDLGRLIDQPWAVPHFNVYVKESTAFREAHASTYVHALAEQVTSHWNWIGCVAGLLITLVWLFYLYQLNVFARVRWNLILSSFTLVIK